MLHFVGFLVLAGLSTAQSSTSAGSGGNAQSADGLQGAANTITASSPVATINGSPVTFSPQFTVPAGADVGATLIPAINDPEAKDSQASCPGYKGSDVVNNELGFEATLTLAADACNVYGNDVETLNLSVQYQSADRLSVRIYPAFLGEKNHSFYILDEHTVPQPKSDSDANSTIWDSDLAFTWTNDPSFSFAVYRKSTGDALFTTLGTKLIYEDQFIEFATTLPANYNVYGLGETIHGFRLGNNLTRTLWAADVGDVVDA